VQRITALFALCFIPVLLQAHEHSAATKTLVFSHVTVIDATGEPPQPDKTVVIEGDRIVRISSAQDVPPAENAQTVILPTVRGRITSRLPHASRVRPALCALSVIGHVVG
jgi:hypothetical protein